MNENEIRAVKINETTLEIHCNSEIHRELSIFFARRPLGYAFMPAYRAGHWDGWIRLFNRNKLPIGLLDNLNTFAEKHKYKLTKDFDDTLELSKDDFLEFVDALDIPDKFKRRDYQIDAAVDCISRKRLCVKINTAGGKSFVMYLIARFHQIEGRKLLVVVNSTNLVEQLYKDWQEYGWRDIHNYVAKIYGGKQKNYKKDIIIVTWQSMIRQTNVLNEFKVMMVDEVHGAKAKSIQSISKKCINAEWRNGFSGTYQDLGSADGLNVRGYIGPVVQYTDYQMLREAGHVSDLKINNLILTYPQEIKRYNYQQNHKDYHGEVALIETLPLRSDFIAKLVKKLKGNTIVLFSHLDYGKMLKSKVEGDKQCYYIAGEVKTDERELIRARLEIKDGVVLFASYQTFSQGVNIKRVHNIVMASNYKSLIKVIQSIGRSIRTHESKEEAVIYNIVDNLKYEDGETYKNYSLKHHMERLKLYDSEGFDNIEEVQIRFNNV